MCFRTDTKPSKKNDHDPGVMPGVVVLLTRQMIGVHKLNEAENDLCVSLYNIGLRKIRCMGGKLSQFFYSGAFLFLFPGIFKTNIVLRLISESVIGGADVDTFFKLEANHGMHRVNSEKEGSSRKVEG